MAMGIRELPEKVEIWSCHNFDCIGYTEPVAQVKCRETASTGATRENLYPRTEGGEQMRIDLLFTNEVALERLAKTYAEGCVKYGPTNWKKGFPESMLIAHALEHIRLHMAGDIKEDHLAHAAWNLNTLMWVQERKPELMDLNPSFHHIDK